MVVCVCTSAQTGLPGKRTSSVLLVTTLDVLTDAMEVSFAVVLDSVLVSSQNMSVACQCFLCLGRHSCSQCQQVRLGLRGAGLHFPFLFLFLRPESGQPNSTYPGDLWED